MEVEFDLAPEDYQAFARYHRNKPGRVPATHLLVAMAGCVGILAITTWGVLFALDLLGVYKGEGVIALRVGLLFGCLGACLAQSWWHRWVYRGLWKVACHDTHSEWAAREVRVILSPDQLRTTTPVATETYRWTVVWRIAVTQDHAFLYLTRETAILVPRRAFRDASQFDEFVALARRYQQHPGEKPTGIVTALHPESTAVASREPQ